MSPIRSFVPGISPLSLLHIHLPSRINYTTSLSLQNSLLSLHWEYRANLKANPTQASSSTEAPSAHRTAQPKPPPPILLTFSTHPTYTVGRRHLTNSPLSSEQISFLTRNSTAASFHPVSRGGLLTYHGPGQCTGYPLIDLRRFGLSARCYVRMLENAVIRTCDSFLAQDDKKGAKKRVGVSETDPGVWMLNDHALGASGVSDRKICALGVQVTRGVGHFGVGLNVRDEPIDDPAEREAMKFDDALPKSDSTPSKDGGVTPDSRGYLSWGFNRIVACGLEGKSTTWLTREGAQAVTVAAVAERLAAELVEGLNQMGSGKGKEKEKEKVADVHTLIVGERELEGIEGGVLDIRELLTG